MALPAVGFAAAIGSAMLVAAAPAQANDFLHTDGIRVVDGQKRPVVLRGMGLGGWMLQEGYMFRLEGKQQYQVRERMESLIGKPRTAIFYRAWLDNFVTKADIDALADWGYNSVRIPLHYNLFTRPTEREPVAGRDTWIEDGFARVDRVVGWAKANNLYVILDLHAAPGGQGTDLAIADVDPTKPSLWASAENRRKTIALWRKLATRYADEPTIGAYDIINEPNADFSRSGDEHGCKEQGNAPLRQLLRDITGAIRAVDKRHMIVIEGNCWGNNYAGILPLWDDNTMLSFHKYWSVNDAASIAQAIALRDQAKVPLWLGESGENSNGWFRDAIALVEANGIGWAFWPLKKMGVSNPLEIVPDPAWDALAGWIREAPGAVRPDPDAAFATLMRVATHDVRMEHNRRHPDVVDAMIRMPHSDATMPFRRATIGAAAIDIAAIDYDMGAPGFAYADQVTGDYHSTLGGTFTHGNQGRIARNDGVDIARDDDGAYVDDFRSGEWIAHTLTFAQPGTRVAALRLATAKGGRVWIALNGGPRRIVAVPAGAGWSSVLIGELAFQGGNNRLVVGIEACSDCRLRTIAIGPAS